MTVLLAGKEGSRIKGRLECLKHPEKMSYRIFCKSLGLATPELEVGGTGCGLQGDWRHGDALLASPVRG